MIKSKLSDIRNLIANDDIEIALKDFFVFFKDTKYIRIDKKNKFETNYYSIANRFNNLKELENLGTNDPKELKIFHSQIIVSFLNLLTECENIINNSIDKNFNSELTYWNDEINSKLKYFKRNYSSLYQGFSVLPFLNESEKTILDIYNRIAKGISIENGYWIDNGQIDNFNLIYTNTSVLYFFIQLGFNLNDSLLVNSIKYLDTIDKISIENRAKWYFDIQTNRISNTNALKFVSLLEENQINDKSFANGAFKTFRQVANVNAISPSNLPTHYGGFSFHACLISDVLLHLNPQNKLAKDKANKILNGVKSFLFNMTETYDGYLIDGNHEKNAQYTSWYYFLCNRLGSNLPEFWEDILSTLLTKEEENMFKSAFFVMNLSLILLEHKNILKKSTIESIVEYYEQFHEQLFLHLNKDNQIITYRDLSIYGRALLYANKSLGNRNNVYDYIKTHTSVRL